MRPNSQPLPFSSFLLFAALALHLATAVATATDTSPAFLFARAISCESGSKVCGQTCIPNSYTCCPSADGGCPADTVCQQGDNGLYGCCPTGQICDGDGGAQWVNGTATSTASVSIVVGTASATGTAALADKTNGAAPAARRGLSGGVGVVGAVVAVVVGMV